MKSDIEHRLYILMRDDLPSMSAGKAMAQASHASNHFIYKFGKNPMVKEWQGKLGFGTVVVLTTSGDRVFNIINNADIHSRPSGHLHDPTYPYIVSQEIFRLIDSTIHTDTPIHKENGEVVCFRNELTCGYVFLPRNSPDQIELVGGLSLHP